MIHISNPKMNKCIVGALFLAACLCSNAQSVSSVSRSAEPMGMPGQVYRVIDHNTAIAFITSDELEVRVDGENIVCKYTKHEGKLRVLINSGGTTIAKYFDITSKGLVGERGEIFYGPDEYLKVKAERTINAGLLRAVEEDDVEKISQCIEKGALVNSHSEHVQPLVIAATKGKVNAVRALLRNGADPNIRDSNGQTPLMIAAKHSVNPSENNRAISYDEVVLALCEAKAEINMIDKHGNTALMLALRNDNLKAAKILLEAGADRSLHNQKGENASDILDCIWVDNMFITTKEVRREQERLSSHISPETPADQIPLVHARLLGQAVENLVVRQLLTAEMKRMGVVISRQEMEKAKRDMEKGLDGSKTLNMLLADANVTMGEFESNMALDLFKNKVLKTQMDTAHSAINEDVAFKYYQDNIKEFTIPAGRLASHILFRVSRDADTAARAEARAKAEDARKALLQGADFSRVATEKSECASRSRGGALGVIPRGREAPAFEHAVYTQKIGLIGEVVESPTGLHIILVTGEQKEKVMPFDEIKGRLIVQMQSRAKRQILSDYIKGLRDKATITMSEALADAAAKGSGGEN